MSTFAQRRQETASDPSESRRTRSVQFMQIHIHICKLVHGPPPPPSPLHHHRHPKPTRVPPQSGPPLPPACAFSHSDAWPCVIHLRCRSIFQSPDSPPRGEGGGEKRRGGGDAVVWRSLCQPTQVAVCLDPSPGAGCREEVVGGRGRGSLWEMQHLDLHIIVSTLHSLLAHL